MINNVITSQTVSKEVDILETIPVVFYSRVSTDDLEQLKSLKNQPEILKAYLDKNPNWKLYESYLDEGITGLNVKKRFAFKRMMVDAQRGKFKILIAKSVSRFGRNMTDTNLAWDILRGLGIRIIFMEDNIDSINTSDVDRFGLMTWLAEQESMKTSYRVNSTFQKIQKDGLHLGRPPFGYKTKDHKLYIYEEQAIIIREIFDLFLQGYGIRKIADMMNAKYTDSRPKGWNHTLISRLLENTAYMGDTHTKLYKTVDIKQKIRKKSPLEEREYFYDTHPAIINRETFAKVQEVRDTRSQMVKKHQRQSSVHLLSNLVVCGRCGASYVYIKKTGKYRRPFWSCLTYQQYGIKKPIGNATKKRCSIRIAIFDTDLIMIVKDFFSNLSGNKETLVKLAESEKDYINNKEGSVKDRLDNSISQRDKLRGKLEKMLDLYQDEHITKVQYLERTKPIQEQVDLLTLEIQEAQQNLIENNNIDSLLKRFLEKIDLLCDEQNWTNQILKEYLHCIEIVDKNNINIVLNIQKKSFNTERFLDKTMYQDGNDNRCHGNQIGAYKLYELKIGETNIITYLNVA